jgi:hypothetical protein
MNSNSVEIITRRANTKDIPLIIDEWKKAYPATFKYMYPQRWNWMVEKNPFISNSKDILPLWISIHSGKIVGWSGSLIEQIEINQQVYSVDMGIDTYVLRDYRKKGLSYKQHSFVVKLDSQPAYFAIQSWAPMIKVNCKLGAKLGVPFFVYYKLVEDFDSEILYSNFLSFVEKRLHQKGVRFFLHLKRVNIHRYFSKMLSLLFKIKQKQHIKIVSSHHVELYFQKVDTFDDKVDELWDRCRSRYNLSIRRDSKYLNWKFVDQPHLNYQKYLVYKNNSVYGVLIFRIGEPPEIPVGVIAELYTDDGKNILTILNYAENELKRQGATMIRCGASEPTLKHCLESMGYKNILVEAPVVRLPNEIDKKDYDAILDGVWLMSMGDHDIDIRLLNHQPNFSDIIRLLIGKIPVRYSKKKTS